MKQNTKMKQRDFSALKKWCLSILFCLLSAVLLWLLAECFRDRNTTLSAFYSEPENSLDVVFVGSSHVNNGYMPNILWEQDSLSACNVYSWSQPSWISYHYIKEVFKTQHPKYVVLDLFGMTYGNSYVVPEEIDKTSYANSFNVDMGLNFYEMIQTTNRVGIDLREPADFLNLSRYHTRWKELNAQMFTYDSHDLYDILKGFGLTYACEPLQDPNIHTDEVKEPYEFCMEYLEKTVQYCKKEGTTLILVMVPYVYNEQEAKIYNWIENYALAHDLLFLNYNGDDGKRVGIDYQTDFCGIGHVNFYGAKKITDDIAALLKERTAETKKEHKNWEQLDEDYRKYTRVLTANTVMETVDLESYLSKILEDVDYTLYLCNSGMSLSHRVIQMLQQSGVEPVDWLEFTAVVQANQIAYSDIQDMDTTLFDQEGKVAFSLTEGNPDILLNDVAVYAYDGPLKIVLYDNILQRPLETVTVTQEGVLLHREFTSDIVGLFKKQNTSRFLCSR